MTSVTSGACVIWLSNDCFCASFKCVKFANCCFACCFAFAKLSLPFNACFAAFTSLVMLSTCACTSLVPLCLFNNASAFATACLYAFCLSGSAFK